MKSIFLGVAATALSLGLGISAPAKAQNVNGWHWVTDGHQAYQLARGGYIIGKSNAGNGNYFVEYQTSWNSWSRVANGAGISIAVNAQNQPFVVSNQNVVWKLVNNAWYYLPTANCEGGTLSVSKTLRNGNIAVGNGDNAFVIATDGAAQGGTNIRRFTGTCWEIMPGGGKAVEIGMTTASSDIPWARTAQNGLWAFNGSGWTQHQTAIASATGVAGAVGSEGTTLWTCDMSSQSCSIISSWTFGAISAVATPGSVIGPGDKVYYYTFGP